MKELSDHISNNPTLAKVIEPVIIVNPATWQKEFQKNEAERARFKTVRHIMKRQRPLRRVQPTQQEKNFRRIAKSKNWIGILYPILYAPSVTTGRIKSNFNSTDLQQIKRVSLV